MVKYLTYQSKLSEDAKYMFIIFDIGNNIKLNLYRFRDYIKPQNNNKQLYVKLFVSFEKPHVLYLN